MVVMETVVPREFEKKKKKKKKRIAVLKAKLRKSMETIKALEKFMEFDRLQKDCSDKLDRERERRMKAERDLEREIACKNCGGNPCET